MVESGMSKCPKCGHWAFDFEVCRDCGYKPDAGIEGKQLYEALQEALGPPVGTQPTSNALQQRVKLLETFIVRAADCLRAGRDLDEERHPGWCGWAKNLIEECHRNIVKLPRGIIGEEK